MTSLRTRSGPGRRWLLALTLCLSLAASYFPVPSAFAAQEEDLLAAKDRPPREQPPQPPGDVRITLPADQTPEASPILTEVVPSSGVSTLAVIPPGAPIVVDSFADFGGDTTPGDNICAHVPSGGKCTLRAAIMEANARAGADTIWLPAGTYTLALAGSGEDGGATGDLDITGDLTVIGSNGNAEGDRTATIVQAGSVAKGGIDRVFQVNPNGAGAVNATFQALTIRNGSAPGSADFGYGGGISFEANGNTSSLTLYNVVVTENKTAGQTNLQGGAGGGLDLFNWSTTPATVLIEKSVISNNATTVQNGGGISVSGMNLTLRDTTVSGNIPTWPTASVQGGGMYVQQNSTVTIERSHFANNVVGAAGDGAGIYLQSGTVHVKSSTFSGNTADSDGGAIVVAGGTLTLTNVTMTANTATTGNGGGLRVVSGTATLTNSIVYGNTAITNDEISGSISGSNNMVGNDGTGGLTNGVNGNKVGINPLLGALGNYGGWTQTYKLQAASPAIEAGTNTGAPAYDQRGFARIADSADTDGTATADIGAYEAHPTMSDIANQTAAATVAFPVSFYVGDAAQGVAITATSSNQSVVPDGNLVITNGSTHNPTLSVTGTSVGSATITVTVSGGGDTITDTFVMNVTAPPKASLPIVTWTTTNEDTQSTTGLVLTPNAADTLVTHFKISGITNGKLYKNNGTTEIANGSFITKAEGAAGLKFTPAADFNGATTFTVQAAYDTAGTGLSDPATVNVSVTAVNDPPIGDGYTHATVDEDSGVITIPFATLLAGDKPGPDTATDESSQTLSLTGVALATGGSATISGTDVLFTPAANFHGTASFTYTLRDSGGASTPVTVTIPVTPVADTPSVTDTTTAEDTQSTTGLVVTPNAVDGAEVTHFQVLWVGSLGGTLYKNDGVTAIANGSYIPAADGAAGLKYTPNANTSGTYTLTVRAATSGAGAGISGDATATITVTAVNDAPVGVNDTLGNVAEDSGPWTIPFADLTGNDSKGPADESSQTLTVSAVSNPTGGTVTIAGTDVIFTPAADFNGTASFDYTVQDSGDAPNTGTATASFTVTAVNDAPVGTDDTLSAVDEDSAARTIPFAALLGNDSAGPASENGQTLTITGVSNATGGTATIVGTDVMFTLAANYQGTAGFTYTLADNGTTNGAPDSLTATANVTFTVNGVAEKPVAIPTATTEDTMSAGGLVIMPDGADGASVTHFQITGITGGQLYKNDGTTPISNGDYITAAEGAAGLKFMPLPNLNTPNGDTFEFTVKAALDAAGTGMSSGTPVTVTVAEVNDAPAGMDDTGADVAEDAAGQTFLAADLLANDSKGPANEAGQALTITGADNAVGGTVSLVGGNVVFTPGANYQGPASFRYTLSDSGTTNGAADPQSSTAMVTFTITPSPDLPQITEATTAEDTQTTSGLVVTRNALDGAEITHFQVTAVTGGRLYKGGTELTVGSLITAAEGAAGLTFTPDADANGNAFSISLAAHASGSGLTGPAATAAITVTEVNDAPTGVNDTLTAVAEDSGLLEIPFASLLANDLKGPANESGQTLTIADVTAITGGGVEIAGSVVRFIPSDDFYGTATFTYTVQDDGTTNGTADAKSSTATVSIPVTPAADTPSVTPTSTAEDTQSTTGLVISHSAVDGAEVTHFQITGITGGKLYLSDGTSEITNGSFITAAQAGAGLKFTPSAEINSTLPGATFTFTVKAALDAAGAQISDGTAAVITVTEVNDAPTGVNDTLAPVLEDSGLLEIPFASLLANDLKGPANEGGQSLTIVDVTAITGGGVEIAGNLVRFIPSDDFYGTATFTYTVQDDGTTNGAADAKTSTATVSIPVTAVADTPSITATTTAEDTQSTTGLVISRNVADGPEVTHFQLTGITGGKLYHNNGTTEITNGTFLTAAQAGAGLKFTPAADANSTVPGATFTFTVKAALDGAGAGISGGTSASITVTEVNDAPTGGNDTLATVAEESGPWTIPFAMLTANDVAGPADENGQALTVANVTAVAGGTVAISGTDVVFTPNADFNGTASFTYTVRDNGTTSGGADPKSAAAPATVTFTVTPVNDAPIGTDDVLTAVVEDSAPRIITFADLLANDKKGPDTATDEATQTLTITDVSAATGGTATIEGSTIRFTLTPNHHGSAGFTYTVEDNGNPAKSDTAAVSFTVTPAAEPPVVTPATTPEDTRSTTGLVISRHAADGAEVTHFKLTGITGGKLYHSNGTTEITNGTWITFAEGNAGLKFTPDANLNTPANGTIFGFSVEAALDNAGAGISGATPVVITVTEVNDAPTGVSDTMGALTEDFAPKTFFAADLLANDLKGPANESGQSLSITAADTAVGGTVDVVNGNVVFTPNANFYGTASFWYTVTDDGTTAGVADHKSSTAKVTFAVTPVADAPQITPTTTAEDTQSTTGLVITRNAADGAEVTHFEITGITGGKLYHSNGTTEIPNGTFITEAQAGAGLKFTPAADANSTIPGATFGFTAKASLDGAGAQISGGTAAVITVTEVNDAPTGVNETLAPVLEDSGLLEIPFATLLANDLKGPANEGGQTLTITEVTAVTGGGVEIAPGNLVRFIPSDDFHGTATFTYTVEDNGTTGGVEQFKTGTATVSVPVTAVADTPSVTAATTAEDTQSTTGLVISRNVADGPEVTHFQITGISGGKLYHSNGTTEITNETFITAAQAGAGLKFTPAADANSTVPGATFTFTVKAALDAADTSISGGTTASITVTEVNDAPTGVNDDLTGDAAYTVAEDSGPWTFPFAALTANDQKGPVNENGQILTIASVTAVAGGTVTRSGTDVIFTPNADFNGTARFTYMVQDNGTTNGGTDHKAAATPATVSFTVTPVNDDPIASDDVLTTVAEDSAQRLIAIADLLANDKKGPDTATDEATQSLTIIAVSGATGGTATIEGSNIRFTLTPNHHGSAGFTYTVEDSGTPAKTDTATVSFTVTPVAEAPAVAPATTPEDTQSTTGLVISRHAADGAEVTHFQITAIAGGQLYLADGTTPVANGAWITFAQGNAGLKFTPDANLNTPASGTIFGFSVQAALNTAGDGISPSTPVTITVTEVNDAPTGVNDSFDSQVEDFAPKTFFAAELLANDLKGPANESGQTLSITAADTAVGGTVEVANGDVVFTPNANFYGTASFWYTVTDNGTTAGAADHKSSRAKVTFAVTPVADLPQVTPTTTAEDTQSATGLVITRNSADGAEVTHFEITGITGGKLYHSNGTTEIANGTFITEAQGGAGLKFTPAANQNTPAGATFGFTVKAALDGSGAWISGTTPVSITVTEVNDAPTGVADTLADRVEDSGPWTVPLASLLSNDLVGPNENGQTLRVIAVGMPVGGSVAIAGTNVVFTPNPDFNGTASFEYTVQDDGTTGGTADPQNAADPATVTFTVTEVNDAPIGMDDDVLPPVAEDSGVTRIAFGALTGNDPEGPATANEGAQNLTIIAIGDAVGGTVALEGTDVLFTPALNFNGTASFTYTLQDDGTTNGVADPLSATAVARVTVTPVNDVPVANDQAISVTLGATFRAAVSGSDVDGDPLTYAVVGAPTVGNVTMNADGTFSYVGLATGTDRFTFKANDGLADSVPATVTVTIIEEAFVPYLSMSVPVTETRESSIVVTGTANPGHYVAVNGSTVQADAGGSWSATVPLVEGPNTITAVMAPLSQSAVVVRDTTPPRLVLTASETRTEASTVVLAVATEEGARVTIEGRETSSLTVPLKMGQNRFTATATDRLGNQSTATVTVLRVGKVPPVLQEIERGEAGEATMQNFRVNLPGHVATEPLLLQVLSPTADTAAVRLAEGAAELAGTGDSDVTTQAAGTPLKEITATVTFTYDPAKVSNPADLRIYYFDPKWKVWVELGGVIDRQTNSITVPVGHFTTFAAMVPQQEAPVLDQLPAEVDTDKLTVTGTAPAETAVSLVINGESQATVMTDKAGRYTMEGTLAEGRNWVYVKSTGTLASREMAVNYQPDIVYTDIGGHWAEATINRLARLRIASIYPEPLFQPNARVTRLEFAVMVTRVLGLTPLSEAPAFTDTEAMPEWARPEVAAAVKAGIIKGMPDGSFAPNNLVTRAEMAIMLTRALGYAGKDTQPGTKRFADQDQIPAWALDQVLTASRYGLITGYPDGSFQPANTTTRAEAVTMLSRLLDSLSQ